MRHQILTAYYQLSLDGKVEPLKCLDADHPILVPTLEGIESVFKCLVCSYKLTPGLEMGKQMVLELMRVLDEN